MSPLLEMRSITKEYRGVAAVEDVSFELKPGKSTLLSARMAPANQH